MRQNEFILKVVRIADMTPDARFDYELYGFDLDTTLSITAWDNGEQFMIDQHITGFYPALMELDIEELCEGDMVYSGELTIVQMADRLQQLGFVVHGAVNNVDVEGLEPLNDEDDYVFEEEATVPRKTLQELNYEMLRCIEAENYNRCAEIRDEIAERFPNG